MTDGICSSAGPSSDALPQLPAGWELVPLTDVVLQFLGGGTPSTKDPRFWNGDIPWTTSAQIGGLYLTRGAKTITSLGLQSSSSSLVPAHNLLVGTRVGVGKVAVNTIDIAISQDLTGLILRKELVDERFLALAIMSPSAQRIILSQTRGVTIKGIPREDLARIPIPLPPLPEQRAIASVFSAVLGAIEATEAVIEAAQALKKSSKQHLFTNGHVPFGGSSQGHMVETEIGAMPATWQVCPLAEVVTETQYGANNRAGAAGRYPILRMNNLAGGGIDLSSLKYVDLDSVSAGKFLLKRGDLLFNRTNSAELVGKVSFFDLEGELVFASYLIRLRTDPKRMVPQFLNHYMNWGPAQARMRTLATRGVGQSNISASKLRQYLVPQPPLRDQADIVSALNSLDAKLVAETDLCAGYRALFSALLPQVMTGEVRVPVSEG